MSICVGITGEKYKDPRDDRISNFNRYMDFCV
jgi:hypothetical protein